MIRFKLRTDVVVWCCVAGLVVAACNREESKGDAAQGTTITAAMQSQLAMADEVDGTKDAVVSRCAGCVLGMDGSADHALQVGEFQMHFCSDVCRTAFAEDVEKSVLAMTIPGH